VGPVPFAFGTFVEPNIVVAAGGPLLIANDAALTALGFGNPGLGFQTFVDFNGGTSQTTGSLVTARTISLLAMGGTIDTNRFNSIFLGNIINSGSLTKMGAGTLTLSGSNTYTGGTIITGGTLQLGNGRTSGSIVGNVTDNGTLTFDRSDVVTFAGVISGTGGVAQRSVRAPPSSPAPTPTRAQRRSTPAPCRRVWPIRRSAITPPSRSVPAL
jgi:autotransporter-associated beta strand protein